jgi:hypothetical protein
MSEINSYTITNYNETQNINNKNNSNTSNNTYNNSYNNTLNNISNNTTKKEEIFNEYNNEKNYNNNAIVNNNMKNNIISSGKDILEENDFLKNLNIIMENNDFRVFYENYFKDFSDIKVVILYMKLYETIKKEYKDKYNYEIENEMIVFLLRELINEKSSRKYIFESFQNYIEGKNSRDKKFILDIFEKKDNGTLLKWVNK